MDIAFSNVMLNGVFSVNIGANPISVSGNALVANIFEITFMTNLNDSLMSFGYGGDGVNTIKMAYDSNDPQSIAAMVKIAMDNTVSAMIADQAANPKDIPTTEQIDSASLVSITKVDDQVRVIMKIIPVEWEPQYLGSGLTVSLPL